MRSTILIIALCLALLGRSLCAADSPSKMVACWYDVTLKRYALAVDLSLGYYPPEGHDSFKTLDGLRDALTKLAKDDHLLIMNEYPHGSKSGRCRALVDEDRIKLMKGQPKWQVHQERTTTPR
jgi:hypothetical protein